ncbi:MAG: histone H1 [Bacteroidia bacterium]
MEKYAKLKGLVISIEDDFSKFYDKGNKAAGTRARKAMQEIKVLAQEIRKEIQDKK